MIFFILKLDIWC